MATGSGVVASYGDFAADLVAGGILSDPWVDGAPRFRMTPVVLDVATARALRAAGEAIARAHDEAARICMARPDLVRRFFDLPPALQAMWDLSAGAWHGIARADVFLTADGPKVCELNSDTPSGAPEAVALNRAVDGAGAAPFDDPNAHLADRICDLVDRFAASVEDARPQAAIGIVYPTEMTEDLSMIELYARWFGARGRRVVLGSPFNLAPDGHGGVALFGVPCPVIWRHYKTDWWGERQPAWRSEPSYPDAAPLALPLALLGGAVARGRCAVINPFGAVVTQNKRTMALMWEEIGLFSARAQAAIRRYVPYTARLERLPKARLRVERDGWVLKSDYGCEGEEVVIGRTASPSEWASALDDARPGRWIAQRRFDPIASRRGGHVNHGVYVVAGRAAGLFTRLHRDATDRHAICAPTLVRLP